MASDPRRVIARFAGREAGPLLIAIGGLHGNEPSGVHALRRVARSLEAMRGSLRGDVLMLAGNVGALEQGQRFIAHDLNRGWSDDRLAVLRGNSAAGDAEDREQLALADAIEEALASARGPVYLVDLHATSAAGIPFSLCADTREARAFAAAFPVTLVLGLLDVIHGTLAGYYGSRCVAAVVEGGQNSDPATEDHHEAVVWLAMVAAGVLGAQHLPDLRAHEEALARTRGDLPHALDVHHRHAITDADQFRMEPGFANIQRIAPQQLLAHDRRGEIRAPGEGYVLMPLYQAKGDDGFFLAREVEWA